MLTRLHRHLGALLIAPLCLFAAGAQAQMPKNIRPGELALLPEYCPHTLGFSPGGFPEGPLPSQVPWIARLGPGFWALHHYCWALINANRAVGAGVQPATRTHLLGRAIDDINYVFRNTPPDFVLRPELHYRTGEYLERLGQHAPALDAYALSWRVKPDYWPAYRQAAALQARLGLREAALKTLDEGLLHAPDQTELMAARERLRGIRDPARSEARPSAPAASGPK